MALFGKKKRGAQTEEAPATTEVTDENARDDAADEASDFDAISRDLDATNDGPSPFDELLANPAQDTEPDETFDMEADDQAAPGALDSFSTADFTAPSAQTATDADVDFSSNFDGGASNAEVTAEPPVAADGIDIEPVAPVAEPVGAPAGTGGSLLNTAPILTTDIQPGSGGAAPKRGLPLAPLLGAGALLLALAGAGWWQFGRAPEPEEAPIVASAPPLQAPAEDESAAVVEAAGNTANPGIAPAGAPPAQTKVVPAVDLTPQVKKRLQELWKQGADAKHRGDIAGARAAWEEMLRVRPGHPLVQEAIDKLPK